MKKNLIIIIFTFALSLLGCSQEHEHTFSNIWNKNDEYHWHDSVCGHDVISGKAKHVFEETVVEPTQDKVGYTIHRCSICEYSYKDTEIGPLSLTHTVVWKNYDGTILEINRNVVHGTKPLYFGDTPRRDSTPTEVFTFVGWSPDVAPAIVDAEYTALFSSSFQKYTVNVHYNDENLGTVSGAGTYECGSFVTLVANAKYALDGWYEDSSFNIKLSGESSYTFQMSTSNIDVFVKFIDEETFYWGRNHGVVPYIYNDAYNRKRVKYGMYPQTHVKDETLIGVLESLSEPNRCGWYLYNSEYYYPFITNPTDTVCFDGGGICHKGEKHWFKVEPIVWKVLSTKNGSYLLLSEKLLDGHVFNSSRENKIIDGQTISANNYEFCEIRDWLNGEFLDKAFFMNSESLKITEVNNSVYSTIYSDNPVICSNTNDKVFLLSYSEYKNTSYGFSEQVTDTARLCSTTDFARANHVDTDTYNGRKYTGDYFTRSPFGFGSGVVGITSFGSISSNSFSVIDDSCGIRPAISIVVS